jgi:hypothetical protein
MNENPTGGISGVDPLRAIIAVTERVIFKFLSDREAKAAAPEDHGTSIVNQVAELVRADPVKQTKTVEELAAMIHQDLSQIEGCPEAGIKVTVYGLNPWNCLLTFGVDAGKMALGQCAAKPAYCTRQRVFRHPAGHELGRSNLRRDNCPDALHGCSI